ncbi:MAG: hypothetical protein WAV18_12205 [Roseiarcus sp.]
MTAHQTHTVGWFVFDIPFILAQNFITASVSTVVVLIFIFAILLSRIKEYVPSVQEFIDNHTAVADKPLQILGLLLVCAVTIVFWIGYFAAAMIS